MKPGHLPAVRENVMKLTDATSFPLFTTFHALAAQWKEDDEDGAPLLLFPAERVNHLGTDSHTWVLFQSNGICVSSATGLRRIPYRSIEAILLPPAGDVPAHLAPHLVVVTSMGLRDLAVRVLPAAAAATMPFCGWLITPPQSPPRLTSSTVSAVFAHALAVGCSPRSIPVLIVAHPASFARVARSGPRSVAVPLLSTSPSGVDMEGVAALAPSSTLCECSKLNPLTAHPRLPTAQCAALALAPVQIGRIPWVRGPLLRVGAPVELSLSLCICAQLIQLQRAAAASRLGEVDEIPPLLSTPSSHPMALAPSASRSSTQQLHRAHVALCAAPTWPCAARRRWRRGRGPCGAVMCSAVMVGSPFSASNAAAGSDDVLRSLSSALWAAAASPHVGCAADHEIAMNDHDDTGDDDRMALGSQNRIVAHPSALQRHEQNRRAAAGGDAQHIPPLCSNCDLISIIDGVLCICVRARPMCSWGWAPETSPSVDDTSFGAPVVTARSLLGVNQSGCHELSPCACGGTLCDTVTEGVSLGSMIALSDVSSAAVRRVEGCSACERALEDAAHGGLSHPTGMYEVDSGVMGASSEVAAILRSMPSEASRSLIRRIATSASVCCAHCAWESMFATGGTSSDNGIGIGTLSAVGMYTHPPSYLHTREDESTNGDMLHGYSPAPTAAYPPMSAQTSASRRHAEEWLRAQLISLRVPSSATALEKSCTRYPDALGQPVVSPTALGHAPPIPNSPLVVGNGLQLGFPVPTHIPPSPQAPPAAAAAAAGAAAVQCDCRDRPRFLIALTVESGPSSAASVQTVDGVRMVASRTSNRRIQLLIGPLPVAAAAALLVAVETHSSSPLGPHIGSSRAAFRPSPQSAQHDARQSAQPKLPQGPLGWPGHRPRAHTVNHPSTPGTAAPAGTGRDDGGALTGSYRNRAASVGGPMPSPSAHADGQGNLENDGLRGTSTGLARDTDLGTAPFNRHIEDCLAPVPTDPAHTHEVLTLGQPARRSSQQRGTQPNSRRPKDASTRHGDPLQSALRDLLPDSASGCRSSESSYAHDDEQQRQWDRAASSMRPTGRVQQPFPSELPTYTTATTHCPASDSSASLCSPSSCPNEALRTVMQPLDAAERYTGGPNRGRNDQGRGHSTAQYLPFISPPPPSFPQSVPHAASQVFPERQRRPSNTPTAAVSSPSHAVELIWAQYAALVTAVGVTYSAHVTAMNEEFIAARGTLRSLALKQDMEALDASRMKLSSRQTDLCGTQDDLSQEEDDHDDATATVTATYEDGTITGDTSTPTPPREHQPHASHSRRPVAGRSSSHRSRSASDTPNRHLTRSRRFSSSPPRGDAVAAAVPPLPPWAASRSSHPDGSPSRHAWADAMAAYAEADAAIQSALADGLAPRRPSRKASASGRTTSMQRSSGGPKGPTARRPHKRSRSAPAQSRTFRSDIGGPAAPPFGAHNSHPAQTHHMHQRRGERIRPLRKMPLPRFPRRSSSAQPVAARRHSAADSAPSRPRRRVLTPPPAYERGAHRSRSRPLRYGAGPHTQQQAHHVRNPPRSSSSRSVRFPTSPPRGLMDSHRSRLSSVGDRSRHGRHAAHHPTPTTSTTSSRSDSEYPEMDALHPPHSHREEYVWQPNMYSCAGDTSLPAYSPSVSPPHPAPPAHTRIHSQHMSTAPVATALGSPAAPAASTTWPSPSRRGVHTPHRQPVASPPSRRSDIVNLVGPAFMPSRSKLPLGTGTSPTANRFPSPVAQEGSGPPVLGSTLDDGSRRRHGEGTEPSGRSRSMDPPLASARTRSGDGPRYHQEGRGRGRVHSFSSSVRAASASQHTALPRTHAARRSTAPTELRSRSHSLSSADRHRPQPSHRAHRASSQQRQRQPIPSRSPSVSSRSRLPSPKRSSRRGASTDNPPPYSHQAMGVPSGAGKQLNRRSTSPYPSQTGSVHFQPSASVHHAPSQRYDPTARVSNSNPVHPSDSKNPRATGSYAARASQAARSRANSSQPGSTMRSQSNGPDRKETARPARPAPSYPPAQHTSALHPPSAPSHSGSPRSSRAPPAVAASSSRTEPQRGVDLEERLQRLHAARGRARSLDSRMPSTAPPTYDGFVASKSGHDLHPIQPVMHSQPIQVAQHFRGHGSAHGAPYERADGSSDPPLLSPPNAISRHRRPRSPTADPLGDFGTTTATTTASVGDADATAAAASLRWSALRNAPASVRRPKIVNRSASEQPVRPAARPSETVSQQSALRQNVSGQLHNASGQRHAATPSKPTHPSRPTASHANASLLDDADALFAGHVAADQTLPLKPGAVMPMRGVAVSLGNVPHRRAADVPAPPYPGDYDG